MMRIECAILKAGVVGCITIGLCGCFDPAGVVEKNYPDEILLRDFGCTRAPNTVELFPPLLPPGLSVNWILDNGTESEEYSTQLEFESGGSRFVQLQILSEGEVIDVIEDVVEVEGPATYAIASEMVLDQSSSYFNTPAGNWYSNQSYFSTPQDTSGLPDAFFYFRDAAGNVYNYSNGIWENFSQLGLFRIPWIQAQPLLVGEEYQLVMAVYNESEWLALQDVSEFLDMTVLDSYPVVLNDTLVTGECGLRYPTLLDLDPAQHVELRMELAWE